MHASRVDYFRNEAPQAVLGHFVDARLVDFVPSQMDNRCVEEGAEAVDYFSRNANSRDGV